MQKHLVIAFICFFLNPAVYAQQLNIDSLFSLLEKAKEDTNRVNLYRLLSVNLKFTDPREAIVYGKKGVGLSTRLGFNNGTAGCYLGISTGYIYSDKLDSALLYLDTALVYAHKGGNPNQLGLAYLNRADIYRQLQNHQQSLKDCETALQYAEKANNNDVKARVNQTFGTVFLQQDLYTESIPHFNKAIELYRQVGNLRMSAAALNNLSIVYKMTKDFPKAIASITGAIQVADSLKDITNQSTFNGNLADIYIESGNYEQGEIYAGKAMDYAVMQKNEKLIAIAHVFRAKVFLGQKKYAESISLLNKVMPFFIEIDETDRIYTTADMLAEAYAKNGNYAKAYENMLISKAAGDSLVKWEYDDDIAAMQTKFEVKEKDNEILLLNKDKELQQQRIQKQRMMMIGTAALAILGLGGIWLLLNRTKLKQRMKELELRNQIAADLHDEVGSSLSSIHMLSQMAAQQGSEASQKDILARMSTNAKETMDKMGDIVWMIKPGETEGGSLKQRMERFAFEICNSRNIDLSLQLDELEKARLTMVQRKNVYLIFKEALNNAVKYSGSQKITVEAVTAGKELTLFIKDEGKGFDTSLVKKGNGLDNMKNRAKDLGAVLDVQSVIGEGVIVQLKMLV